jgi:antitoxin HicB
MEKNLNYYMGLNYPVSVEIISDDGEDYYSVEIPDLPGCGSYGSTLDEAFERLEEAKELWLDESIKRGLDISEPVSEDDFSGKFLLRIPARLHMKLTKNAKANSVSLNQYVKSLLEKAEIVDSMNNYLVQNNEKFNRILDSQNTIIARLEKRLENLESLFSPRYMTSFTCQTSSYVDDSPLFDTKKMISDHFPESVTYKMKNYCIEE